MIAWAIVALELIELHAPNGARILMNPLEITSIREPAGDNLRRFAPGTHCVVVLSNSQFNAVRESCDAVAKLVGWPK